MSIEISISGMGCEGCEEIVENALGDVESVEHAEADHETGLAVVEGDADADELLRVVDFAGYSGEIAD